MLSDLLTDTLLYYLMFSSLFILFMLLTNLFH